MILARLKKKGVEDKLWRTQFGFRSGCGTRDAIFIARRLIEQCHNCRNQHVVFLALDWAKAFDSIDPRCLVAALRRFGLPEQYLNIIASIYSERHFVVADNSHPSSAHRQFFGISQGCPLSPFLFVMLMTVLLHDAREKLENDHGIILSSTECNELIYADDTLLVGAHASSLQHYMNCIAAVGKEYGLSLNLTKLEQLNVNIDEAQIYDASGGLIQAKASIKYLGAQLKADGHIESEIMQKLGVASREFDNLRRIWNHCHISQQFKFTVFTACVVQKLLYSLECSWLNKAMLKKIDGFYARCLRKILKISPSFVSRVSNQFILQQFRAIALSKILFQRQLCLFGRIARLPDEHMIRQLVFDPGSTNISQLEFRKRGRPRHTWAAEVSKLALQAVQGKDMLTIIRNKDSWERLVKQFSNSM